MAIFELLKKKMNKPLKEYKCSSCDQTLVIMFDGPPHQCDQYMIAKKAVREVLEEMGFKRELDIWIKQKVN